MSDPERLASSTAPRPLDWMLLGRYALLIALCDLIPVPFLDGWVENLLRRRMVRSIGLAHGFPFGPEALAILGDRASGGCMGCLVALVLWPVKKLLKLLSVIFQVKGIADTLSEVLHRGLLLEEAFEAGWLPGEPERVRAAMDRTLSQVDTRVVERMVRGSVLNVRHQLSETVRESVRIARERKAGPAGEALADAAEQGALGPGADEASRAMVAALRGSGLVPEVVAWFRAEMGEVPVVEARLGGPLEPELVAADAPEPQPPALPAPIEDAVELKTTG